jgi:general secretion pathway protein C
LSNPRDLRTAALIVFVSLALSAFFLAQGTTGLLAAVLLPMREAPPPSIDRAEAARLARRQTTSDETILRRNIFDPVTGDVFDPPAEITGPDDPIVAVQPWQPGDLTNPCTGSPVRLVGAVVSPSSPTWSFAALVEGTEKAMLFRTGMMVGSAEVLEIARDRVVLRSGGTPACHVAMFAEDGVTTGATVAAAPAEAEESEEAGSDDASEGITRVGTNEYNVNRALITGALGDQAALMRMARVIPQEENGQTVGVKLYGVRRSSLLGRLGIRNGDMLRDINGLDLSSPDAALQAYAQLPTANDVTVNIQRRGQDMALKFHIQD